MRQSEVILEWPCVRCRNFWPGKFEPFRCSAFPLGIPEEIVTMRKTHKSPWPVSDEYPFGDFGVQFEEIAG